MDQEVRARTAVWEAGQLGYRVGAVGRLQFVHRAELQRAHHAAFDAGGRLALAHQLDAAVALADRFLFGNIDRVSVGAGLDAQEVKSALTLRRGAYDDIKQDAKEFLASDYAKQMLDYLRS